MRLQNSDEFVNSQRKLSELLALIESKEQSPTTSPAYQLSLHSMKQMAKRLRTEIEEFERAHQPS